MGRATRAREAVKLIDETLKQEKAADQLWTKIAESGVNAVNTAAR